MFQYFRNLVPYRTLAWRQLYFYRMGHGPRPTADPASYYPQTQEKTSETVGD